MYQTYAVIDSLSFQSASAQGGAVMTINGNYFDPANTKVKIGGKLCVLYSTSSSLKLFMNVHM